MQRAIEEHLKQLVGLPLWAAERAASLLWLQFGERHTVPAWRQGTKEVGSFVLHIDCPWSWKRGDHVIANADSALENLSKLVSPPIVCRKATAQVNGSSAHAVLAHEAHERSNNRMYPDARKSAARR